MHMVSRAEINSFDRNRNKNKLKIVYVCAGELFKSVVASGRTPKIAKENAVYKFLRLVRHHEFEVDIDTFSEQ